MRTLHLRLLGGFEARVGDAALAVGPRKARALLAHLALAGPRPIRREAAATLLWGRTAQRQALASLNQALYVLRKALDAAGCPALQGDADTIRLDRALVETDVDAFSRDAADERPEAWRAALAIYGGPLLDGLSIDEPGFEAWLAAERTRLSDIAASVGARLLAAIADAPETGAEADADPTPVAETLLAIDPLDETAIRALMRADARAGRPARALSRFEALRRSLAAELDVAPAPATSALADDIRSGAIGAAPPSPSRAAHRSPSSGSRAPARGGRRAVSLVALVAMAIFAVATAAGMRTGWFGASPDLGSTTPRLLVAPIAGGDERLPGLASDLATELSRLPTLAVLARETARSRADWPPAAARAVGATHVLAGSVRGGPADASLTLRLVDAGAGAETWARRYALREGRLLAVRERAIADVLEALALATAPRHPPPTADLVAYDAYLEGLARFHDGTPQGNAAAASRLAAALERDPALDAARATLAAAFLRAADGAAAYADALDLHWSEAWLAGKAQLARLSDAENAAALALEARLALRRHDLDAAAALARRAIARAPSHADAHRALAEASAYRGDHETARAAARRALALDPAQPAGAWMALALAAIGEGALPMARDLLERSVASGEPAGDDGLALLAALDGLAGETQAARARLRAYAAAREGRPRRLWRVATPAGGNPRSITWARPTLATTLARFPFADPATVRRLADGLAAAGMPGAATVAAAPPLDPAERLDDAALRAALFGATVHGIAAEGGAPPWRETRGAGPAPRLESDRPPAGVARPVHSTVRDGFVCDALLYDGL